MEDHLLEFDCLSFCQKILMGVNEYPYAIEINLPSFKKTYGNLLYLFMTLSQVNDKKFTNSSNFYNPKDYKMTFKYNLFENGLFIYHKINLNDTDLVFLCLNKGIPLDKINTFFKDLFITEEMLILNEKIRLKKENFLHQPQLRKIEFL